MLLPAKHQVYRVVYDKATPSWTVQMDGRHSPLTRATSKTIAIDLALGLARSAEIGQVFVHGRDGSIEAEHSFGEVVRAAG